MGNNHPVVLDPTGLGDLGNLLAGGVGGLLEAAGKAMFGAAMLLMRLVLTLMDAFLVPDLGTLVGVLPYTLALAGVVWALLLVVQLLAAMVRRDGGLAAQTVLGTVQFVLVLSCYLTVWGLVLAAVGSLTRYLMGELLGVGSFAEYGEKTSWVRDINDGTGWLLLGLLSLFLVLPACVAWAIAGVTRALAILTLGGVSPITAAGLVSKVGAPWFWKTNRWMTAAALMPLLAVLVMGLGSQMSQAALSGAGSLDSTLAGIGAAVVGMLLFAIASACPLALFRLLAFVDPGTTSGAAFRAAVSANGGVLDALRGGGAASGAATREEAPGHGGGTAGEATAASGHRGRLDGALARLTAVNSTVMGGVAGAADRGSDALNMAGVGDAQHAYGYGVDRFSSNARRSRKAPPGESPNVMVTGPVARAAAAAPAAAGRTTPGTAAPGRSDTGDSGTGPSGTRDGSGPPRTGGGDPGDAQPQGQPGAPHEQPAARPSSGRGPGTRRARLRPANPPRREHSGRVTPRRRRRGGTPRCGSRPARAGRTCRRRRAGGTATPRGRRRGRRIRGRRGLMRRRWCSRERVCAVPAGPSTGSCSG